MQVCEDNINRFREARLERPERFAGLLVVAGAKVCTLDDAIVWVVGVGLTVSLSDSSVLTGLGQRASLVLSELLARNSCAQCSHQAALFQSFNHELACRQFYIGPRRFTELGTVTHHCFAYVSGNVRGRERKVFGLSEKIV